ncbi:MAG: MMPL family transporter, partial [Gemmatimonadetes bacterium]|nr:MMPL family transporter [Gemmatimonadota bacterium]
MSSLRRHATPVAGRTVEAGVVGRWIVRQRLAIALVWAAIIAAVAPSALHVSERLTGGARIPGSESADVQIALGERFASPFGHYVVLVATGIPSPTTDMGREALQSITTGLAGTPGLTRTLSYLDVRDPLFVPRDAQGTIILAGISFAEKDKQQGIETFRARTRTLVKDLHEKWPRLALRWTGDLALDADLRKLSSNEIKIAEARVLPLTLLLLLAAFGAIVAALLPVVVGVLAITLTLGVVALIAHLVPLSILLQNMATMLGLGLGVDYALLTLSRFREALSEGRDREEAAAIAASAAGHTILVSGAAVIIGFVGLLLVPLNEMRSMAVGGLIVVFMGMALSLTLLPALLVWAAPALDRRRRRSATIVPAPADTGRWWSFARMVVKRPVLVLAVALPPVLLLAWQSWRLETRMPKQDFLPRSMESALALEDLMAMGHGGIVYALRVLVEVPVGQSVLEGDGWQKVSKVAQAIEADKRTARVRSLPGLVNYGPPNQVLLGLLPGTVRQAFASADGRLALLEVQPAPGVDYQQVTSWVRDLRQQGAVKLAGMEGVAMKIGGLPAFNADYEDLIASKLPLVIAFVVLGTLLALFIAFRSIMVPIKAVLLNLLAVMASFGAVTVVFLDGHGATLVGLDGAATGLFPSLPVLVFCIVFGLSMDYEVFLVARVAEARKLGRDESEALVEGLARTGGVITSAAAIMVAVFAAFTLGELLLVKVMGFALAAAVFLDATIIRMAIGPALLRLAGKWNWWPGDRWDAARRARAGRGGGEK